MTLILAKLQVNPSKIRKRIDLNFNFEIQTRHPWQLETHLLVKSSPKLNILFYAILYFTGYKCKKITKIITVCIAQEIHLLLKDIYSSNFDMIYTLYHCCCF